MEEMGFYHSQSHQNDPLGCAAAGAVIDIMKKENAIGICHKNGSYLKEKLMGLANRYSVIKEIRGRGLMMALEFSDHINHDRVVLIYDQLLEKGFIVAKRPGLKVFRIDPPLIITRENMDDFVHALDTILSGIS